MIGPGDAPARRPFWGWRVVGAGALINMLISGVIQHAYTNYAVLLEEEFAWSTTVLAAAFAMNRLESGLLGPLQGWMIDRLGPRRVIRIGAVTLGIGLVLFSTLQNAFQFFVYYFIVAVGASLAGFIAVVTAVVNWFERRRSRALSLAQAGFALGAVILPVVVFSLTRLGWRTTAAGSGVLTAVIVFVLASQMHHRPSDVGQEVDGGPDPDEDPIAGGEPRRPQVSFTPSQAMRTRAFWMIGLGHALSLLVVGSVMAHLSLYLTSEQGFVLQDAAYVGGGTLLLQLAGTFVGGWLGDRYNKQLLVIIAMFGHVTGMLMLTYATTPVMVWLFVPMHGLAWGVRGPLMQAMRADYFGAASFGTIMGFSSLIMMLGTTSGPIVVGVLRDQTGGYTTGFTTITIVASLAVVMFALATRPNLPQELEDRRTPARS